MNSSIPVGPERAKPSYILLMTSTFSSDIVRAVSRENRCFPCEAGLLLLVQSSSARERLNRQQIRVLPALLQALVGPVALARALLAARKSRGALTGCSDCPGHSAGRLRLDREGTAGLLC